MGSVLVQDPFHPYAEHLMKMIHQVYGHRAVCFFTDRRERARLEPEHPILRSPVVEATYEIALGDLAEFAGRVRKRHDVVATLPFNEETLLAASQLAEWLDIGWNPLATMSLFRDKHAFKDHLRRCHPHIRVNASRLVETVDDAFPGGAPLFERFILKPNSGLGNRDVAYFDERTPRPREAVAAYLRCAAGRPTVLEEHIRGPEYFVNGQVGARGEIDILATFRYSRVAVNGRLDIDYETRRVRYADPIFEKLAAYTRDVIRASGLARSPFHVEIRVDERGPCLIEANARLAGHGNAFVCNDLHGGRVDLFRLAAHGYLTREPCAPPDVDWKRYDATTIVYVHGIGTKRERIHKLEGMAAVEGLPSFAGWVRKPRVDEWAQPTVSALTMPWCVLLRAPADPEADDATALQSEAATVRALLVINAKSPWAPARRVLATTRAAGRKARWALRWGRALLSPRDEGPAVRPSLTKRASTMLGRVVGRLQRAGFRRLSAAELPEPLSPTRIEVAGEVLRWARDYIAMPHSDLGRKGAICPFVPKSIQQDRLLVVVHDEVDGSKLPPLRAIVLVESERFARRFPPEDILSSTAGLILAFPSLRPERFGVMDAMQNELKTHLMTRDMMIAAFHPHSTKPAQHNPSFAVFQSNVPCLAIRPLDVRDIVFLGSNREAFAHFQERFGERFAKGLVSNEFGYVQMYEEALARWSRGRGSGKV